ncbi:MAG: CinA family nicotinamide mononucleotide deamidase-related protein [Desulfobulbaceae bacterium]|nr:CinA family nicotinamide mononucleotide deamidase-related protein [Desulfobulbaceae bacterium]
MIGEIIAIGDELTSGRIVNTTSSFAAIQLFAAGHDIFAMHTIGDTPSLIGEALMRAIERVDFVIVTGGLGATSDDLTNEAVSEALKRPQTLYREILNQIQPHIQGTANDVEILQKLAWLPEGAEVLNAESKMAGYLLVYNNTPIFFLPGVPGQMKQLFVEHVLPCLAGWTHDSRNHILQRTYRTFGISENMINKQLKQLEHLTNIRIGYYPVDSEVHVSLTVSGQSREESEALFIETDTFITKTLGETLYGFDQESMASVIGELLRQHDLHISVAESCTGGLIASKITETAGSSEWFIGGVVAYSNELKEQFLGVDKDLLSEHGSVSAPVARAMAVGIAAKTGSSMSVSVTGVAGPTGGTLEKPVGTVHIGLVANGMTSDYHYQFSGNRREIQEITAQTALNHVRLSLLMHNKGDNNVRSD